MGNNLMPPQQPSPLLPPGFDPNSQLGLGQGPVMPGPPPPPSPSLGFQIWAPQNTHKVQASMTDPNQPLQPNAGSAAANPPQPTPMASATPPPTRMQAALTPPAPQPAAPQPSSFDASSLPLPTQAPLMAAATPPRVQTQDQANLATDQANLRSLGQSGAAANHIKNPVLRTLAQIGNIAAPFLLGQGAMAVPGTTAHNLWLQQQAQGRVNNDRYGIQAQQGQLKDAADLAHTQAETGLTNANIAALPQKLAASASKYGLKPVFDSNGNFTGNEPDEESPVYQKQQLAMQLLQSTSDLKQAQTAVEQMKGDPNSAP